MKGGTQSIQTKFKRSSFDFMFDLEHFEDTILYKDIQVVLSADERLIALKGSTVLKTGHRVKTDEMKCIKKNIKIEFHEVINDQRGCKLILFLSEVLFEILTINDFSCVEKQTISTILKKPKIIKPSIFSNIREVKPLKTVEVELTWLKGMVVVLALVFVIASLLSLPFFKRIKQSRNIIILTETSFSS
ncbi:hypothetical protein RF11_15828 [Thelohanellus kitauei]|uniref:Uncharacterized protein n=1 Tax=Thelohanellus kitauei TaxID=669202 RepID=A0A0C2M077_THEKT|nr:hypothetical protein RF11_15828 [Thelohanellus kitauei]